MNEMICIAISTPFVRCSSEFHDGAWVDPGRGRRPGASPGGGYMGASFETIGYENEYETEIQCSVRSDRI